MRVFAEAHDLKLGKVAQPLRAALTGKAVSPPVFDMMEVLGKAKRWRGLRIKRHNAVRASGMRGGRLDCGMRTRYG